MRAVLQRRSGITLVEMLIVMGLVAMLGTLLMPAVTSVRKTAWQTQCANRLHTLGSAYIERSAARQTPNEPAWATRWQQELGYFAEKTAKLFICPEGYIATAQDIAGARVRVTPSSGGAFEIPWQPGNGRCRVSTRFASQAVSPKYALEFEDGADNDWNDLALLIAPNPLGTATVTVLEVTGTRFELIAPDQSILLEAVTPANYSGRTCQVFGVGNISYGMNSAVHRFADDSSKILVIDYKRVVADVVGSAPVDNFGVQVADRHRAACNVLFANGSVKLLHPADFDPRIPQLQNMFWKPKAEVLQSLVQ